MSVEDILRTVGAGLQAGASAAPDGPVRTALSGAVVIVDAARAVMDAEGLTAEEVVLRIRRVPPIDTSADDATVDGIVAGKPSRGDG